MAEVRRRRPPAPFRIATVAAVTELAPAMVRLHLAGEDLVGFERPEPSASMRLLIPRPPAGDDGVEPEVVELPDWQGNEFLYRDGTRPPIRVFTPRDVDPEAGTMDVDVYLHEHGTVARWVGAGCVGKPVAVSGPGRGYPLPTDRTDVLLVGDATAQPAIDQLLAPLAAPSDPGVPSWRIRIRCEAVPAARVLDPVVAALASRDAGDDHRGAAVDLRWFDPRPDAPPGSAVVDAVLAEPIDEATYVWAAGEAAAMQRVRNHLFRDLGLPRRSSVVRGYWKVGQAGATEG